MCSGINVSKVRNNNREKNIKKNNLYKEVPYNLIFIFTFTVL